MGTKERRTFHGSHQVQMLGEYMTKTLNTKFNCNWIRLEKSVDLALLAVASKERRTSLGSHQVQMHGEYV